MQTDNLHITILNELQLDARISNAEIGRRVGLSAPAISARIKDMENNGIIKGFTTNINFKRLGYSEKALVGVKLPKNHFIPFINEIEKIEGVTDIVRSTGEYCLFITLIVKSGAELNEKLNEFGSLGETTTFFILSEPIENKPIKLSNKRSEL